MAETYSREALVVAAAFAWCMNDFLDKLGVEVTQQRRRYLAGRLAQLGIDTSHWDRSPRRWYTDDMLRDAARVSVSYAAVLRHLGVPVTGGQHAHLARRIRAAGIDTSHFLGQAHFRGTSRPPRSPEQMLVLNAPESGRVDTKALRRALLAVGVPHLCATCGIEPKWRGEPLTLVIDHINGDFRDNRRENLRFLCPNCHSQTATWCRKNRAPKGSSLDAAARLT
jgi:hypothetical protein